MVGEEGKLVGVWCKGGECRGVIVRWVIMGRWVDGGGLVGSVVVGSGGSEEESEEEV